MNRLLVLAFAIVVAGCSKDADAQRSGDGDGARAASNAPAGGAAGARAQGAQQQGGAPGGARGAGGPARGGGMVTLAASDIAVVRRANLEDGIPITGNLEPIERIQVRAQLEGDLVGMNVREGQRVRKGEVLARFESSEQESNAKSAEADVIAARSDASNAQWNLEQTQELFKQGAVPERDLKTAQQTAAAARARLAAAEARLRSTSITYNNTRVVAPADGTIEKRLTANGEHVTRGQALFTLVRTGTLELAAAVPANRANSLAPGQPVKFTAEGRQFEGRVARVSPTVDPSSRSVAVYVQVPNASGQLKGGTFAQGRVIARINRDVLVVPNAAIRQRPDNGQTFTYKVDGQVVATTTLRLGIADEALGLTQVLEGLKEGDRVITGNVGVLGNGMRVQVLGTENRRRRS